MIERCRLCPRECAVARGEGESQGFCRCPADARIALASLHMWEEPPISGENGSGAVFFTGCTLGCVYCQNREISGKGTTGRKCSPAELAETFRSLEEKGAHNLNLVTGTQYIPEIIKALRIYRPGIPIVWNSGGYESEQAILAMAKWVDVWLPDYKYALSPVAQRYSMAPDYPERAMRAIRLMKMLQPENIYENGLIRKGLIIRHLVLPLNTENSIAALQRIAQELPDTQISLMSQYTPVIKDERYPELGRGITRREYEKVCAELLRLGLDGYVQELSSSRTEYIPAWDY